MRIYTYVCGCGWVLRELDVRLADERRRVDAEEAEARDEEERAALAAEEAEARRKVEAAEQELNQARLKEEQAEQSRRNAERERHEAFREKIFGGFQRSSYYDDADEIQEAAEFEHKYGDLEKAWMRFEKRANSDAFVITVDEVPFVTRPLLRRLLPTSEMRAKGFKKLAKRYHPDKFQQRFGGKMVRAQEAAIMEKVKLSFQIIQELCQDC